MQWIAEPELTSFASQLCFYQILQHLKDKILAIYFLIIQYLKRFQKLGVRNIKFQLARTS